ncbi:VIT domain-containing protein [Roseomonas sp. WA12]
MPRSSAATVASIDPLRRFSHLAVVNATQRPIPLSSTRFSVHVTGALALVTAERTFCNAEAQSIEATMTFPVPVQAALVSMSARIAERTLVATAQRKELARQAYEEALDGGKTAVLHEEVLRGIHMISVGHVPPGKEVSVSGVWAMPLTATGETLSMMIPTTVGDVYGRSPLPDSDDLIHDPILHQAELEVTCDGSGVKLGGGRLLDGKARVRLDRPIEIVVPLTSRRVLHGVAADGRGVELKIAPAAIGQSDLDVLLVEDTSGSMNQAASGRFADSGPEASKHQIAVRGLLEVAAGLRASDRAEIWAFGSTPFYVGRGTGPADVRQALSKLPEPNGGTELGLAIDAVLDGRDGADILLVTDGKSHAIDVHALARRGARFTVVLVGEDSLAANVGHLAVLTGGQTFVSSGLDLAEVLQAAVDSMRAPRAGQILVPRGGPIHTAEALTAGMAITARWFDTDVDDEAPTDAISRSIAAYAAWLALPLMDEADAAEMAEAEGLVCHLTSMLLVDEGAEQQEGIPVQRKVPLMTPATTYLLSVAPSVRTGQNPGGGGHLRISSSRFRSAPARLPSGSRRLASFLDTEQLSRKHSGPANPQATAPLSSRAATPPDLKQLIGRLDWSCDLEALRRGEVDGNVPPDALVWLHAAAELAEVRNLAACLGLKPITISVALLARAEGVLERGAARFARAVLGQAEPAMVKTATIAVGL